MHIKNECQALKKDRLVVAAAAAAVAARPSRQEEERSEGKTLLTLNLERRSRKPEFKKKKNTQAAPQLTMIEVK